MSLPRPQNAMRAVLSLGLLGCFMVALFWLMQNVVPEDNRDLVNFMLGQLAGFTGAGVFFYLGTSKSSADKNDWMRERPTGKPDDPISTEETHDGDWVDDPDARPRPTRR